MAQQLDVTYPNGTLPSNSNYPNGVPKNATSEEAKDGFPFDQGSLRDIYGFLQALTFQGGIEISGNPDTALVSDYLEGAFNLFGQKLSLIADLPAVVIGRTVIVDSYHPGLNKGGGAFVGGQGVHNGGTVIDPSRVFPTPAQWAAGPTDQAVIDWFDTGGGLVDAWVRLDVEHASIEMFGGFIDGIADDTAAFLAAQKEYPLKWDGTLKTSGSFNITTSLSGGKLIIDNEVTISVSGRSFLNFEFSADGGHIPASSMVKVAPGVNNILFGDSTFGNVHSDGTSARIYALQISANNCSDIVVHNCAFKEIRKTTVLDTQATDGFCGGIYVYSDAVSVPSKIDISSCRFINIETVGNTSLGASDADGIRFYTEFPVSSEAQQLQCTIKNTEYRGVEKSCIKLSNVGGVDIDGVTCWAESEMEAVIRIQYGESVSVSDVTAYGDYQHGWTWAGSNLTVDNFHIKAEEGKTSQVTRELIAFQNRKTSVHSNLKANNISCVSADAITRCTDTISQGDGLWFSSVEISNVSVEVIVFNARDFVFDHTNTDDLTIFDVKIKSGTDNFIKLDGCRRWSTKKIKTDITGRYFSINNNDATRSVIGYEFEVFDVELRRSSASLIDTRMFEIRTLTPAVLDINAPGTSIKKIKIFDRYADAAANNEVFSVLSSDITIDDIEYIVSDDGVSPVKLIKTGSIGNFWFGNIKVRNGNTSGASATFVQLLGAVDGYLGQYRIYGDGNGVSQDAGTLRTIATDIVVKSPFAPVTGAGGLTISADCVAL
jgi:hypothetical protein